MWTGFVHFLNDRACSTSKCNLSTSSTNQMYNVSTEKIQVDFKAILPGLVSLSLQLKTYDRE